MTSLLIPLGIKRRVQLQLFPRQEGYQVTWYGIFLPPDMLLPDIPLAVYGVFFLETLQTALSGADLYYWFADGFGDVERLTTPNLTFFDAPILGSIVSLSVQFFFVYRIWVLSNKRRWWLCVLICLVISPP